MVVPLANGQPRFLSREAGATPLVQGLAVELHIRAMQEVPALSRLCAELQLHLQATPAVLGCRSLGAVELHTLVTLEVRVRCCQFLAVQCQAIPLAQESDRASDAQRLGLASHCQPRSEVKLPIQEL